MPTIANVALSDTFDLQRTRLNQIITYLNTFDSNAITFTSNSATLNISGTGRLGSTLYFDIGQLSSNVFDQSTSNIASANSVYQAYFYGGIIAYNQANVAYNQANIAYNQANIAYNQANAAYAQANVAYTQGNTAYNQANTAYNQANAAYAQANNAGGYWRGNNGDKGTPASKQDLFRINSANLTSNIGFDNGENALTTGPINIDINRYLIVNTGARVVIV